MNTPRQMTIEEVNEMRANSSAMVQIAIRQIIGGFVINGIINWMRDGSQVAQQNDEAIAITWDEVLLRLASYESEYTFNIMKSASKPGKKVSN